MTEGLRVYSAEDVGRLLPIGDCIDAVERAFREQRDTRVASFVGGVATAHGKFHVKAAVAAGGRPLFAAKINANFPDNPRLHGTPTIQGVLVLFDAESGRPLAIMDSASLTIIRTAAATGVAARYLAPRDARTLAIVGCGAQALMQVAAIRAVRPIRKVVAFDLDRATLEEFVAAARHAHTDADITPAPELARCTPDAEIVVTCTPSRTAFLEPAHVARGAFVAAVGTDNPDKSEIAPGLMAESAVIVDDVEQCAAMGDLHHAIDARRMMAGDVWGTLAGVVGEPRRFSPDGRTIVFDSTGVPLQDIAAAAVIHERGLRGDAGQTVRLA